MDAKLYRGLIKIRDRGGLLRADGRLYVRGRDCSHLADNTAWQVEAVTSVQQSAPEALRRAPVGAGLDQG